MSVSRRRELEPQPRAAADRPRQPGLKEGAAKAGPAEAGAGADPANTEEVGGPKGPEPTRYGDWERNGRCSDF